MNKELISFLFKSHTFPLLVLWMGGGGEKTCIGERYSNDLGDRRRINSGVIETTK